MATKRPSRASERIRWAVGDHFEYFPSDVTEADRYFRLYLLLPDGRMQSSELFYADF